jgi:DEAD/DEAH box helicase domain-containing protein
VTITPTASGKTLCTTRPVLNAILAIRRAARYLFPTKALAQISSRNWAMCEVLSSSQQMLPASACSSTTATRRRTHAAQPIPCRTHRPANPDMVHSGILPHHPRWAKLFENLR